MKNKAILWVLILSILSVSILEHSASAWGVPQDIYAQYAGAIRVRARRLSSDANHTVYVRKCTGGYGGPCDAWQRLGTLTGDLTEFQTSLQVLPNDYVDIKIDSNAIPSDWNPIVYSADRVRRPRPGEDPPGPRVVAPHGGNGQLCGDAPPMSIADLLASSYYWLSSSCWEDWVDYDWNDLAFVVDYVPGSIQRSVGVHVRNPQGTPLPRDIGGSEVEVVMWWAWFAQTQSWGTRSDGARTLLTPTSAYNYQGGYVLPNSNEKVLGITPVPADGWDYAENGKTSYNWYYNTWPQSERHDVYFILATHTPTPSPTSTPTNTPTPTPTSTPTPTPTPVPLNVVISRDWPWLVWYGGQPPLNGQTQVLRGYVSGHPVGPGFEVLIHIAPPLSDGSPCDIHTNCAPSTYSVATDVASAFMLDAVASGNANLGTEREGIWQAWAEIPGSVSNVVSWDVQWNRSHVTQ